MLVRARRGDGSPVSISPQRNTHGDGDARQDGEACERPSVGRGRGNKSREWRANLTSDKVVISGDLVPVPRHPEVSRLFSGNISLGLFFCINHTSPPAVIDLICRSLFLRFLFLVFLYCNVIFDISRHAVCD